MRNFYDEIKDAKVEKEVDIVYENALKKCFLGSRITYDFKCDGYLESSIVFNNKTKVLRLIMEFKLDEDFNTKIKQSKVLIQVLYYLKSFICFSKVYPELVLVGDKNDCFIIPTEVISEYLNENINWNLAPSDAPDKNSELLAKLNSNQNINPFVFKIDNKFTFEEVAEQIKKLAFNIKTYVKITERNISTIYDYFIIKVVTEPNKYNVNDLVFIFLNLLIDPVENYMHPNKKNTLVLKDSRQVRVNGSAFKSFFNYYEINYSPKEKETFTEISDRLIEDTHRRFNGEFYTPTVWADEANRILTDLYGEDWRDKYVVWDCAWGTGNLTRDYNFNKLYCSTIYKGDLIIGEKYNSNAEKFEYDFLNDDIDLLQGADLVEGMCKMPKSLITSFKENQPIIFFINPPFVTAGNAKSKDVKSKVGAGLTKINKLMKKNSIGKSSQQIYAQFIYRILMLKRKYNLTNIKLALFSPTLLLSGPSYENLRKELLKEFKFQKGIMFNAGHFYDVSNNWGISFSVWEEGSERNTNDFKYDIEDISERNTIICKDKKIIYNLDGQESAANWIKVKNLPQSKEAVSLKSPINPDSEILRTSEEAIGYFINDCNNIYANAQGVYIMSSKITRHVRTIPIYSDNIKQCMSLFAARKLIKSNWINQKDEYMMPNEKHDKYMEWENDCIIYSLFSGSSYQSSLRNIKAQGKAFNVFNELFFMSNDEIAKLANDYNNGEVYFDAKNFNKERYMTTLLKTLNLSIESKLVLDKAVELIKKSFPYRKQFNYERPEYHINCWDAGWYQVKKLLNDYLNDDLKDFDELFKLLENKMKPLVYELGFLK